MARRSTAAWTALGTLLSAAIWCGCLGAKVTDIACRDNDDCPSGTHCAANRFCALGLGSNDATGPAEGGGSSDAGGTLNGGGTRDAGGESDGGRRSDAGPPADGGLNPPDAGMSIPPNGAIGADCTTAPDSCASGDQCGSAGTVTNFCTVACDTGCPSNTVCLAGFCYADCTSPSDCRAGFVRVPVSGQPGYCYPDCRAAGSCVYGNTCNTTSGVCATDACGEQGGTCSTAGDVCYDNLACVRGCSTDSDCRAGMTCSGGACSDSYALQRGGSLRRWICLLRPGHDQLHLPGRVQRRHELHGRGTLRRRGHWERHSCVHVALLRGEHRLPGGNDVPGDQPRTVRNRRRV